MNISYYLIIVGICIVALAGTLMIARTVSKKEPQSQEEDLKSLKEAENNSSIPMLTIIYLITFLIIILLVWIYIF
ncbi:hypothetical protein [Halobacillus rhizosphaerae]|uniref:hypothetical protein n=1 Tax=Halobacillus rhizosphaerae TaxID=3064889 RepID=UPI00398A6EC3